MPLPRLCRPTHAAVATAILLCIASAHAAEPIDAIVTDRPDFVESSAVVGKGRLQIETSVAAERNRRDGVTDRSTSTPTLLRVGVSDTIELRLETDGWMHTWRRGGVGGLGGLGGVGGVGGDGDADARGMAGSSVGVKWHVRDGAGEGGAPALGLLLHADLPSGARAVREGDGDGVRPSLRGVAEWELGSDMSLGVMPGLASERDDDGRRFTSAIFGVTLGKQWTPQWRSFVEWSAPRIARADHGGTLSNFDIGGAWQGGPLWQIDAALSAGLNRRTPDLSVSIGLSVKL